MWVVKDMIGDFGNILFPQFLKQKMLVNVPIPYGRYLDQDTKSRENQPP